MDRSRRTASSPRPSPARPGARWRRRSAARSGRGYDRSMNQRTGFGPRLGALLIDYLLADSGSTLASLLGLAAFAGCFLALGESRQALHDRIAGTAVFPKAALEPQPAG